MLACSASWCRAAVAVAAAAAESPVESDHHDHQLRHDTYAAAGVICIDFTATGPAGVFDLLAAVHRRHLAVRSKAPTRSRPDSKPQLGINPPSNSNNIVHLVRTVETVSGRFCWFAGADLGFVGALGIQFFLTPVAAGTDATRVGPIAAGCPVA